VEKLRGERRRFDVNFLIIARTDSCRFFGIEEAAKRVNAAAKVGADMGLMFPRNPDEAACAPKLTHVPLIYVQSLGNRDGRPTFSRQELQTMGYAGCIEAQFATLYAFTAMRKALQALATDGRYDGMDQAEYVAARQTIEDIVGLDEYYGIEESTVESRRPV
jgi:2-methylisocitrate lyase-like PEP mutase family enzyme